MMYGDEKIDIDDLEKTEECERLYKKILDYYKETHNIQNFRLKSSYESYHINIRDDVASDIKTYRKMKHPPYSNYTGNYKDCFDFLFHSNE